MIIITHPCSSYPAAQLPGVALYSGFPYVCCKLISVSRSSFFSFNENFVKMSTREKLDVSLSLHGGASIVQCKPEFSIDSK